MEARLVLSWRGATGGCRGHEDMSPPVEGSLARQWRTAVGETGGGEAGTGRTDSPGERGWRLSERQDRGLSRVEALRDQLEVASDLRALSWLWKVTELEQSSRTPAFPA